jgi:ankyrin repeat protein
MNMGELVDELCDTLISSPVDVDRVRQLIAAGAYPDECFLAAIDTGKLEIVKIFVEAGANVNYIDDEFNAPLSVAKYAVLRIANGEYDDAIDPEYDDIVTYLEGLTNQETKDLVEEIMKQNSI